MLQNVLECLLWYTVFSKNHQQSCLVSPNQILRKLATVRQAAFTQFRILFETKMCMTLFEKLTPSWSCKFLYSEEPPLSLPSTPSDLSCLNIYLKEASGYFSFALKHPNPVTHKHKPNYLHPSRWAFQAPLFWSFPQFWLLMLLADVFQAHL